MRLQGDDGKTVLLGEEMDQAHLYGVLDRICDFGLELVSVEEGTR